ALRGTGGAAGDAVLNRGPLGWPTGHASELDQSGGDARVVRPQRPRFVQIDVGTPVVSLAQLDRAELERVGEDGGADRRALLEGADARGSLPHREELPA